MYFDFMDIDLLHSGLLTCFGHSMWPSSGRGEQEYKYNCSMSNSLHSSKDKQFSLKFTIE